MYYRPGLCEQACVAQLQQVYVSAPTSQRYGVVKMVVTPWEDMDDAITSAAWGWTDTMDQPDIQRIPRSTASTSTAARKTRSSFV